jgi:hypothetical protein
MPFNRDSGTGGGILVVIFIANDHYHLLAVD